MRTRRVTATEAAVKSIARLRRNVGPILFYQTGECCDDCPPICFKLMEFIKGDNDVLLGKVMGTPVYVDGDHFDQWKDSQLIIDVENGKPVEFSLAAGNSTHFVTRTRFLRIDIDYRGEEVAEENP